MHNTIIALYEFLSFSKDRKQAYEIAMLPTSMLSRFKFEIRVICAFVTSSPMFLENGVKNSAVEDISNA
jgi:hypothetical protein